MAEKSSKKKKDKKTKKKTGKTIHVKGYTRKDGTKVKGSVRHSSK